VCLEVVIPRLIFTHPGLLGFGFPPDSGLIRFSLLSLPFVVSREWWLHGWLEGGAQGIAVTPTFHPIRPF